MSFFGLAFCLTLLSYAAVVSAGTPFVLPFLRTALRIPDPDRRSRRLAVLRLLPAAGGLVVAVGIVLPSMLWLEPRSTDERVGGWLLVVAALSAAVAAWGIARAILGTWATSRLVRRWGPSARPIHLAGISIPAFSVEESFPIVAIAGCIRPRLFLSRTVLASCTREELAAIVAHEAGHLRRGDPRISLLLRACPDLMALTPLGGAIERHWEEAAEQAADDHAASAGRARALDLASALIKVARLAGSTSPRGLPVTALYRGGRVAARAARLLARRAPPPVHPRRRPGGLFALVLVVGALVGAAAAGSDLLSQVHRLLEAVVVGLR